MVVESQEIPAGPGSTRLPSRHKITFEHPGLERSVGGSITIDLQWFTPEEQEAARAALRAMTGDPITVKEVPAH